jgi:hypothetical protein
MKGYPSIRSIESSFNPAVHNADPNEMVRANRIQPRVSPDIKQNSNRILNQISIETLIIHIF